MVSAEQQLQDLIKRRDAIQMEQQRLQAQLEVAAKNIEALEQEFMAKGINPDQIDDFLSRLQERHDTLLADFSSQVLEAEKKLRSYGGSHGF
jgi:chromosome segregation ATPase